MAIGAQHIQLGDAAIVVAGGQESMSLSPHVAHMRAGTKMGDMKFIDSMIKDGLWDAFNGYHMGQTAENVANQWQISREMQDAFAVASQNKAEAAQKAGRFAEEIVPFVISTRKGDVMVDADEYIRDGATMEAMTEAAPRLREGRLGDRGQCERAERRRRGAGADVGGRRPSGGATPLARIATYATAGVDPAVMGVGPIQASRKALEKAGWKVADLDLVEANEAFAAQAWP